MKQRNIKSANSSVSAAARSHRHIRTHAHISAAWETVICAPTSALGVHVGTLAVLINALFEAQVFNSLKSNGLTADEPAKEVSNGNLYYTNRASIAPSISLRRS